MVQEIAQSDPGQEPRQSSHAIEMLQFLGLGPDAAIIYQFMIRHPHADDLYIAESLGWAEARARRALREIEQRSLVRRSYEQPGEVRLVNPVVGLGALIARCEADLSQHEQTVAECRALTADLTSEYRKLHEAQPYLRADQLIGLDRIRLTIEELAKDCTTELAAFVTGGPQTQENLAASKPLDRSLLERGVRMRTIFLESIVNDPMTTAYAGWLKEMGAEVRTVPSLPARMALYDARIALVAIDPAQSGKGAVRLDCTGIASLLHTFFDQIWAVAEEWGAQHHRDLGGPTRQQHAILWLLAAGDTDAAISRKLGISVRTTRRLIAELADRLDARSRFQIGMRAAEVGWLGTRKP
ncbi:MAG: helix-turn-helix transcriptional regulator [Streptosporangiaceae bacterium]|nr:helix-turn-helix transcriptional regulator [Streptosporangiaceae bacterium]